MTYRPLCVEVDIVGIKHETAECDERGHVTTCQDIMGCWLRSVDDYYDGKRPRPTALPWTRRS